MKKCPYCAEEIQDEAILCRYCRSDVRIPPQPAPQVIMVRPDEPEAAQIRRLVEQAQAQGDQARAGEQQPEPGPAKKALPWAILLTILSTLMSLGAGEMLWVITPGFFAFYFLILYLGISIKNRGKA